MQIFPEIHNGDNCKSEKQIVPRLISGWSFRSWSSTRRRLSLRQANSPNDLQPIAAHNTNDMIERTEPVSYEHEESDIIPYRTIPITGIDMKTAANPPIIGTGPESIWTTVDISAEVGSSDTLNLGLSTPLDIVIILDSVYVFHAKSLSDLTDFLTALTPI